MNNEIILNTLSEVVWSYYNDAGRHDLPWRTPDSSGRFDPYKILVSELMLQQTQVARVIPKYDLFLKRFPSVSILASAELGEVLRAWSGLGYNRRAKYLHQAAQKVTGEFKGIFPESLTELTSLPGVGRNTAGAIQAYAFNRPAVFVETNIRTVFIYHFFSDQTDITDRAITELVAAALDHENPREWYWALMDYGSYLKQSGVKLNTLSKGYTRQTVFHGSKRQIRGKVLRDLHAGPLPYSSLSAAIDDDRLDTVLGELLSEGMIRQSKEGYYL